MNKGFILTLLILMALLAACAKESAPTAIVKPIEEPVSQPQQTTTQTPAQNTTTQTTAKTTTQTQTTSTQTTAPPRQEVVEADDNGFYPSSIAVKKGEKLTILFKVKSVGVYYNGLDFRSSQFNSPSIEPGGSWGTPQFTADETFVIGSYWPASGVHKADFTVKVTT